MKSHAYFALFLLAAFFCGITTTPLSAQLFPPRYNALRETSDEFFRSDEARRIGDQVLLFQRVTGGWPKNTNMTRPLSDEEQQQLLIDRERKDDSTIDNNATSSQLRFLARLYRQTGDIRYRDAFRRGVEWLLAGQYENGGWPQFWPITTGYQHHITFNDDAIINLLVMFNQMTGGMVPYDSDIVTEQQKERLKTAVNRAVDCIIATQIKVDGKPTIWCQQYDHITLKPAQARAYELPSFCTQESAAIVRFLMSLPSPSPEVKHAVHGAMQWFDTYKLTGLRYERTGWGTPQRETKLVTDNDAIPLWGRFYDFEHCEPFVCDRDGIMRRRLEDIGSERRHGYAWYGNRPAELYPLYNRWADQHDPENKITISLDTPGANHNGTIMMFRRPTIDRSVFDRIVQPGEIIQDAIDAAPTQGNKPYKILVLKGTYRQKVVIDRPNIILVGEDRDSTRIVLAECGDYRPVPTWKGNPSPRGVVSLTEAADSCVISGLTIYNDYGSTIEPGNTAHQFALYGRATHTIVINCNINADGNDALSLWAPKGNGMYYHADLQLHCPGVDFLCPRGWCYATRCTFYGDGRAILWHDGRGDKSKKLVVKDSQFDAKRPTPLGRYHHDSQFFVINCRMSDQIKDADIAYAYTDKVLDPCPWGQRAYYHGCSRDGGHSGWLDDNLHTAESKPIFHAITAEWTFDGQWNPEQYLRTIWHIVGY